MDYFVSAGFPLFDFITVYFAANVTLITSGRFDAGVPEHYQLAMLFGSLMVPAWFAQVGIYKPWRGQAVFVELRALVLAWTMFFAALAVLALITKTGSLFSRVWMGQAFLVGLLGLMGARILMRSLLRRFRKAGFNRRYIVVVGDAKRRFQIGAALDRARWSGLSITAQVDVADEDAMEHLSEIFRTRPVDQLWLAMDLKDVEKINTLQDVAAPYPVQVKWCPDLVGVHLLNHSVTEVAGMPAVTLQDRPLNGWATAIKTVEDRLLAAVILIVLALPMALIAVAIKFTSPGPVLFVQKRHGVRGETINVFKFRSMAQHRESGVITSAVKDDARVTSLGRFLRATSLDELPQFVNVLRGEMSIVGPRPHSITQEKLFTDYYHLYPMRYKVKPGITGWAQINGLRGEISSPEKLQARVEHDIYYLRNWSLGFDLYIIMLTAVKGWSGVNAY